MNKNVLLVDDNQEMLLSLRDGLNKYNGNFSVSVAENGRHALEILEGDAISLVVTDLKMPQMDGFALLTHIMEHYPDISVIMMTAYSTPKMMQMARHGGAVGYIEKPFKIEELAAKINGTLKKTAEGGTLHSVSSGIFLQFIEMEERTCTIRLTDKDSGKQGVLFFRKGELIGARAGSLQGEVAAYEIFSWDKTSLSIQNDCLQKKRTIHNDLQAIFLDALLLKDEKDDEDRNSGKKQRPPAARPDPVAPGAKAGPPLPAAPEPTAKVHPGADSPPAVRRPPSPGVQAPLREVPHQRPETLRGSRTRPGDGVAEPRPSPGNARKERPAIVPDLPAPVPDPGFGRPMSLRDMESPGPSRLDEAAKATPPAPEEPVERSSGMGPARDTTKESDARQRQDTTAAARIQCKLEEEIGERCGLEHMEQDASWDGLITQFEKIGSVFNAGRLKVGHVDNGKRLDYVLVPGAETLVLSVSRKGPRDRILQVLGDG